MMEDEAPMMMEEELDDVQKKLKEGGFMCCCCFCSIRCGILFIGCVIIAITLFVFLEIFYELLNDDIHWWYVLVGVLLASTLVVASAFAVLFFTEDSHGSRVRLNVACMLVIIGVSTLPACLS